MQNIAQVLHQLTLRLLALHHRMVGSQVPWRQCLQVNRLLNKNLATWALSSAALSGDFRQSLWSVYTTFSQSNKEVLLNLCKLL